MTGAATPKQQACDGANGRVSCVRTHARLDENRQRQRKRFPAKLLKQVRAADGGEKFARVLPGLPASQPASQSVTQSVGQSVPPIEGERVWAAPDRPAQSTCWQLGAPCTLTGRLFPERPAPNTLVAQLLLLEMLCRRPSECAQHCDTGVPFFDSC